MKTRTLATRLEGTRSEEFKKDFATLMALPAELRNQLPEVAVQRRAIRRAFDSENLVEQIASEHGASYFDVNRAVRATDAFISAFLPRVTGEIDSVEHIIDDLTSVKLLDVQSTEGFRRWLSDAKVVAQTQAENLRNKAFALASGSAILSHVHAVVDVRGIFKMVHDSTKMNQDDEAVRCIGAVPVAMMSLVLDESPFEEVHFQMDEDKLDYLIDELNLLRRRMTGLTKYLNLSESTWKAK